MGFIFGTIKYLFRTAIKLTIFSGIFVAVILLIPNLPPYTSFTPIKLDPTLPRVGPLAPNGALNNAQQLYKGKLLGPEAFQIYNGELYTSVHTGEVLKLSPGGHVTFVTKIGRPCTDHSQEHICGRPLGFEIDEKTQQLYVVDAYHGIWKVDLKTDKKQLLVSPRVDIGGKPPKIFNDLALSRSKPGDLYYTVSSSDFLLKDGAFTGLADPSGRLVHYDAAKNKSTVLVDDLWLANGVVVSPDSQFLVVAESFRYRLLKYHLQGPNKGKTEVFLAGLPGLPDNIRALPDGSGLLVALYTAFDEQSPLLTRSLAAAPLARKLLARVGRLVEIPFEFLNQHFPNPVFEDIVYNVGHFKTMSSIMPGASGLLQVDWEGKIVASYFNTDGSLHSVSDAIVYGDQLMTGAPNFHDFVGAVPAPPLLKKAFATVKSTPPPKTAETVTKQVPQPKVQTKPVEQTKPKAEVKKEQPKVVKPAQAKPAEPKVTTTTPKPAQAKPAEPKVTTTTPKPAQAKPAEPKVTTTTPKPAEKKPVPTTPPPKQTEKVTTQKPPTTKPVTVTPQPKKAAEKPKVETPKKDEPQIVVIKEPKTATKQKDAQETKDGKLPKKQMDEPEIVVVREPKKAPKVIPIKEEIPSDTIRPKKDKMKVIKKDGPGEIPVL